MSEVIVAIKDYSGGQLHAPVGEGVKAACGVVGKRVEHPVTYAARWCSVCMTFGLSNGTWPTVTAAKPEASA